MSVSIPHQTLAFIARIVSAAVALSVLGVCAWAVVSGKPSPFLLGFEVVALVAAYFGWRIGSGRDAQGPAIGLVCVAGAIGAGALLGYVGSNRNIGGVALTPYLLGRAAAAAVLLGIAAWIVLSRRPGQALPSLLRGVVFGVLFAGVAGGLIALRGAIFAMHPLAITGVVLIGAVLALALLAACVHYSIRAFEMGLLSRPEVRPSSGRAG